MIARVDAWETVACVTAHWTESVLHAGLPIDGPVRSPYAIASRLDKLARIGRSLHGLYEYACNEDLAANYRLCTACGSKGVTSKHRPNSCHYARIESAEKRAVAIGAELGVIVECQRDPRGAPIRLWADKVDGRSLGVLGL